MIGGKMRSTLVGTMVGAVLLLGIGSAAHAVSTTIGGADCATCFGSVYTVNVLNGGENLWNVAFSVNTSGYSGQGSFLESVAFKVSNFNDILAAPTVSGVSGFSGTALFSGLNANSCSGGGNSGFICAQHSGVGVSVPNGTYNFAFNGLQLKAGSLFTDPTQWSIKALYTVGGNLPQDARGITSENGRSVPVPGTSLLFGLGFAIFAGWRHQRSRQN